MRETQSQSVLGGKRQHHYFNKVWGLNSPALQAERIERLIKIPVTKRNCKLRIGLTAVNIN